MASLLSFRCPERPSTLPVGAAAKSNGSSSQKLSLLDETEDDEDSEFADTCATQATHSAATTPGIVAFSVGDGRWVSCYLSACNESCGSMVLETVAMQRRFGPNLSPLLYFNSS